ncbi:hypothetical protein ACQEUV_17445 [Micromonospora aurantiaca (nom. illeg.)]|uniref:hypothetical protein n=1 Tax=Micromonospora aurantiaca (nom. illeg.) TaxID=47850 RepID=UPI003DA6BA96
MELRLWFGLLKASVRAYARKQGLTPSSVTRYLNGQNLPPDEFLADLIYEVSQSPNSGTRPDPQRLWRLHRKAQDAQPGTWGHTKQLKRKIREARAEARAAQHERDLARKERDQARRSLLQTGQVLDSLRSPSSRIDEVYVQSWSQLIEQLQQAQTELSETKLLLAQAHSKISELTLERVLPDSSATDRASSVAGPEPTNWFESATQVRMPHWGTFRQMLLAHRGWTPSQVARLDEVSDAVVSKLSDPRAGRPIQRRGMVLGYPQAGMTSDMTAVVAKAIDAGYRLVVVLSAPLNSIRTQLQARLDEGLPAPSGTDEIHRLTGTDFDYKILAAGLEGLQFEKTVPDAPFNDGRNLGRAATRLIVVKKNLMTIRRLVNDLRKVPTPLDEIPALIIDAAVDSTLTSKRDALGSALAELLAILPRAQHVGFATTPLASAFLDPDAAALFPWDFVVSLPRPEGYFGLPEINAAAARPGGLGPAHIRTAEGGDLGLREALDMFVLTAAVKMYRDSFAGRHWSRHGMLVLGPARASELQALRTRVAELWAASDYESPVGRGRLQALFESDLLPVSRQKGALVPLSFAELVPSLEKALDQFGGQQVPSGADPDLLTLGIVVSGPQGVREFSSTGITVIYLSVPTGPSMLPAITSGLGFHAGYQDLMRLYIPQARDQDGSTFLSYLEAYRQVDEEIRAQMAALPSLEPIEIPPLIATLAKGRALPGPFAFRVSGRAEEAERAGSRPRMAVAPASFGTGVGGDSVEVGEMDSDVDARDHDD